MKYITLTTIFFSIANIYCQQLKSTPFNLNTGGYITDVEYFEPADVYVIVGNFSSINGIPCEGIAFLDGSLAFVNYSLTSTSPTNISNPIDMVDSAIYTVAVYQNHIYIGGNFNTINGLTIHGLAKLSYTNGDLTLSSSDFHIGVGTGAFSVGGVHDLEIYGDSLFVSGDFITTNMPFYNYHMCFDLQNAHINGETPFINYALTYYGTMNQVFDFEKLDNSYYLCGRILIPGNATFVKIFQNGNPDPSFNTQPFSSNSPVPLSYHLTKAHNSPIIFCSFKHNAANLYGTYNLQGSQEFINFPSASGEIRQLKGYKSNLYRAQSGNNSFYSYDFTNSIFSTSRVIPQGSTTFNNFDHYNSNLNIARNHLFVSSSNLSSIDNQSRSGLAIFCLEPYFMTPFTTFDSLACGGLSVLYEIDSVKYASGYHWRYTGQGAQINGVDITNSGSSFGGQDKNSITVDFNSQFTPGYLIVKAYSECNELTKDSTFIHISQRPLPQFAPLSDTSITCSNDSIVLKTTIFSQNTTANWFDFQSNFINSDTCMGANPGTYVFVLTNQVGCQNFDTLTLGMDTIPPSVVTSPLNPQLNCSDSLLTLFASSSSPNAFSYWNVNNSIQPDSISINSPGTFTAVAENTINGCKDSVFILVALNYTAPEFQILNYQNLPSVGFLDTLTCSNNSILLETVPADSNTISYWTNTLGAQLTEDTLIQTPGNYLLFAKNLESQCEGTKTIRIAIDTLKPNYIIAPNAQLNCTIDSAVISAQIYGVNSTSYWTDFLGNQHQNPFLATETGNYTLYITDTSNGCIAIDSFDLIRTSNIEFSNSTFLTCEGKIDTLSSFAIYEGPLFYNWSTNSVDSTTTITGGLDETVSVQVHNADYSCIDTNTIQISISPKPIDSFQVFKPCNDQATGIIIATTTSGLSPFTFSLDGSPFQSSNVFDSLAIGHYTLFISDSLGCVYDFSVSINEDSDSPVINFLIPTINYIADTIFISNISNPTPDINLWNFPIEATILSTHSIYPSILFDQIGEFDITLFAKIGACEFVKTKSIQILEADSSIAKLNNQNGIEFISIYPNPTNNNLNLLIQFYKKQNCTIEFFTSIGFPIYSQAFPESLEISETLNLLDLGFDTGTYLLRIIGEYDVEFISIVVSN